MSEAMRAMTAHEKKTPAHVKFDQDAFFAATNARLERDGFQPIRWVRFNVVQGCYVVCEVAARSGARVVVVRGNRVQRAEKKIVESTLWRGVGVARASAEDRRHRWSLGYGKILAAQRAVRNYRDRRTRCAQPDIVDLEATRVVNGGTIATPLISLDVPYDHAAAAARAVEVPFKGSRRSATT